WGRRRRSGRSRRCGRRRRRRRSRGCRRGGRRRRWCRGWRRSRRGRGLGRGRGGRRRRRRLRGGDGPLVVGATTERAVLGLVRLQRSQDPGELARPLTVVPPGLGGVVPRAEVAQQPVGGLLRLEVVQLVLALLGGLLDL